MKRMWIVGLMGGTVSAWAAAAPAGLADFDQFQEGALGEAFEDGGISFFEPDAYGLPGVFVVEWAEDTLGGPNFSPPNALTLTGYTPGPQAAYSRVGSLKMKTGAVERDAEVHLFVFDNSTNTITLEATLRGEVVASDVARLQNSFQEIELTLSIADAEFDELRLFGSGNYQSGAWFGMMDNIAVGGGGEVCTGQEKLSARCKGEPGAGTLKAVLKRAKPLALLTIRLDEDPNTDRQVAVNQRGKAKAVFRQVPSGRHHVEVVECEADDETNCP